MKNGINRFTYFLDQLQALLTKASKQQNPALWLYKNNARTPLFMLEALAKLYSGLHNKKKFTKLDEQFKLLEDILGAIDYYDIFAKEFSANKNIPATITGYLQAQTREKIQSLNEALKEHQWIGAENKRMDKIRKSLQGADWKKEDREIKKIKEFYDKATGEIIGFIGKTNFHFANVESGVHELRRKLRWLSIYPQALRGCIQLGKAKAPPKYLAKYLTKEIVTSPFNKMPDAADNKSFLLLEQNYFYALSWMIDQLGKLKDSGLRVIAIKEALQQLGTISNAAAIKKAYTYLGAGQPRLKQILDNADAICKTYCKEQCLPKLVIGTAKPVK